MSETNEHIILVAVHVSAPTREAAERYLHTRLPRPCEERRDVAVEGWWIAEDDRRDGSDNDPAVFCKQGMQSEASALLLQHGLTWEWNLR
jgi:hypothetical protein